MRGRLHAWGWRWNMPSTSPRKRRLASDDAELAKNCRKVVATLFLAVRYGLERGELCAADSVGIAARIALFRRWCAGSYLGIGPGVGNAVWAHGLGQRGVASNRMAA